MTVILDQFIHTLDESGLIPAEQVEALINALPSDKRPKTGEDLANLLYRQGMLTKFQAQAIYQGRAKSLVLGNYVVLDKIGQGGMGQVYKAQHKVMERVVALKVLPRKAVKSEQSVQRFRREVKAAAKLEHPNIVMAHDADEAGGTHFLVMQFVDGKDLGSIVRDSGPLPVQQAVDCIIQTARGLEYAHKVGIIHRDIKPSNLLLDKAGTVKVLDMGLARIFEGGEGAESDRLTGTGQVMGTWDYMAPEQAEDTHLADVRSDIYSLGCTLYRLVTGENPYGGETLFQVMWAHRESPIPSLMARRPEVPQQLDGVCQRMLAKRAEDRYQSMADVIVALKNSLGGGTEVGQPAVEEESSGDKELSAFLQQISSEAVKTHKQTATGAEETNKQRAPSEDTGESQKLGSAVATNERKKRHSWIGAGSAALAMVLLIVLAAMLLWPRSPTRSVNDSEADQPPPLAIAPFKREQAKQHQEDWADHLGMPVERDIDLGDGVKLTMVLIPPGEFMMGSPQPEIDDLVRSTTEVTPLARFSSEGPQHKVTLTKPFYLGIYEVTQEEYEQVMGKNPSEFSETVTGKDKVTGHDTSRFPVEMVCWKDAVEFCEKISELPEEKAAGRVYRLPTEAEWEYACRAGTQTRWSFGNGEEQLVQYAWFSSNSGGRTHAVGELRANSFGLHDMHGNVWEWCQDWCDEDYYSDSPRSDPQGLSLGTYRVMRGASWGSLPEFCRSAYRSWDGPAGRISGLGFRVVCEIEAKANVLQQVTDRDRRAAKWVLEIPRPPA